jgi:DNA-directed RNA polymerase subunit RPC12/RpoP
VAGAEVADWRCHSCGGVRVIPMTWADRQTGFERPGFKCADCGRRIMTMEEQRAPRPI